MLARGLPWKREAHLLALILVVNDQIVACRLTSEIPINRSRNEQLLAFRSVLYFYVNRPHLVAHERLVLIRRHLALLELPLTFKQRIFIDVCKHVVERDVFNDTRSVERRRWNRNFGIHGGTRGVRRVTTRHCAARPCSLAYAKFCFLAYKIFSIFFNDNFFNPVRVIRLIRGPY